MADSFDPYYTWLGIPPHEQPANHYRLLGISQFEANDEVISNAADRLMLHLRAFQAGKRSKESQQLLNEISAARVTLLDPAKKAKYDAELKAALAAAAPGGVAADGLPVARPVNLPETAAIKIDVAPRAKPPAALSAGARPAGRPAKQTPLVLIIAFIAAALLAIGGGVAFLLSQRSSSDPVVSTLPSAPAPALPIQKDQTAPAVDPKPAVTAPLSPPSATSAAQNFTPPTDQPQQWQDLLATVDSGAERQLGAWQMTDGALVTPLPVTSKKGATRRIARIAFQQIPTGAYRLKLKLTFEAGERTVVVILPVADREVAFSINAFAGGQQRSGFERISGQRVDQNSTGIDTIQTQLGEPHELELIVHPSGSEVQLYALWDDQPATHWLGTPDQLGQLERFSPPGDTALCLCAAESTVRFLAVQLGVISGEVRQREANAARLAKSKASKAAPLAPEANSSSIASPQSLPTEGLDVLKLVDVFKHSQRGVWRLDGGVLSASPQPNGSLIHLPIVPPAPYRVEMVARRESGSDGLGLILTTAGRRFVAVIDGNSGATSHLEQLDGKSGVPENASLRRGSVFTSGQFVRLRFEVGNSRVHVLADGRPVIDWSGDFSRLAVNDSYYYLLNPNSLGLTVHASEMRFYDIRVLPLDAPETRTLDTAAVAKATQQIHADHAEALGGAKKGDQKLALARTLREEAERNAADPPRQAALWLEAQKLAAAGNDMRLALAILHDRCAWFALDRLTESADALKGIAPPAMQRAENFALAETAHQLIEQAVDLDRFDAAEQFIKLASQAYGRLKYTDGVSRLNERLIELGRMKVESEKLDVARDTLAKSPHEPAANLAMGRYLCLFKNDWDDGLPKLAIGSDADIQEAAKKDLDRPSISASRVAVGDLWWEVGQKQPASARRNAFRRASEWYLLALRDVTGNQRATLDKRIEQSLPRRGEPTTLVKGGLVSYWSFDEGAGRIVQDTGVNSNHAALVNAQWTRGCLGSGLKLTADDQYAQFHKRLMGPQGTVALWTRVDRFGPEMGLLTTTDRSRGHLQLSVIGGGRIHVQIGDSAASTSKNGLEAGKWHHVVFRFAGDKCELLIDGAIEASFGANKDIPPIIGPGRIGGWLDNDPGHTLIGAIDDVRLYGRVLTNEEIGQLVAVGQGSR